MVCKPNPIIQTERRRRLRLRRQPQPPDTYPKCSSRRHNISSRTMSDPTIAATDSREKSLCPSYMLEVTKIYLLGQIGRQSSRERFFWPHLKFLWDPVSNRHLEEVFSSSYALNELSKFDQLELNLIYQATIHGMVELHIRAAQSRSRTIETLTCSGLSPSHARNLAHEYCKSVLLRKADASELTDEEAMIRWIGDWPGAGSQSKLKSRTVDRLLEFIAINKPKPSEDVTKRLKTVQMIIQCEKAKVDESDICPICHNELLVAPVTHSALFGGNFSFADSKLEASAPLPLRKRATKLSKDSEAQVARAARETVVQDIPSELDRLLLICDQITKETSTKATMAKNTGKTISGIPITLRECGHVYCSTCIQDMVKHNNRLGITHRCCLCTKQILMVPRDTRVTIKEDIVFLLNQFREILKISPLGYILASLRSSAIWIMNHVCFPGIIAIKHTWVIFRKEDGYEEDNQDGDTDLVWDNELRKWLQGKDARVRRQRLHILGSLWWLELLICSILIMLYLLIIRLGLRLFLESIGVLVFKDGGRQVCLWNHCTSTRRGRALPWASELKYIAKYVISMEGILNWNDIDRSRNRNRY